MRLWMLGCAFVFSLAVHAESYTTLEWLSNTSEAKTDLAKIKLTIDHLIDRSSDIDDTSKKLDAIIDVIKEGLPAQASSIDKLNALKKYLYESGEWNSNQPYAYDFSDPLGHNIHNKLLSTYLATKKGNCVSMPLLFLVLGQKLGLDVSLSIAPNHFFVKFRDESGKTVNLETTDKAGITSDASYQPQIPMTELSLSNGIYMQALTNKQTLSVMMLTLMEFYSQNNEHQKRIDSASLALKIYPKNVIAMVHKGNAYGRLLKQEYISKYPLLSQIPIEERARFFELQKATNYWYDEAEALGFRPPTQQQNSSYLNKVQRIKSTRP